MNRFTTGVATALSLALPLSVHAQKSAQLFDGRPWNVASGNASTFYIHKSPIGAFPAPGFSEAPPDLASLKRMMAAGLTSFEDYVAWGAVEREPGKWDWSQHDRMEKAMHDAGLKYVVYTWLHFPPTWLRDQQKSDRTLMRCLEHGQETNYLSVFDPRTLDHYDHFYKNLKAHFGGRVDDVYACILGPYGEGNYPLRVPDWVDMGHCHEGWWAGDDHARRAFRDAMMEKYGDVAQLNRAWGTALAGFDDVHPPKELSDEKFKPSPAAFPTAGDKRRWLDFITWYHAALVDFTDRSIGTVLKYFPKEKVRVKPGGTSHGINPITYGTDSPAFAKMLARHAGVTAQPADCIGVPFADKWLGTAYHFYGVPLGTEPAGALDRATFLRRMFSDASAGASQLFTYEFEQHVPEIQQFVHLYTGQPGDTDVAVFCPSTLHRLGGDLTPTIQAGYPLRDFCEFDVLDELPILDGALTPDRYKRLLVFQADVVDQPVLDKLDAYLRAGGQIITIGNVRFANVEGETWPSAAKLIRTAPVGPDLKWIAELEPHLLGVRGVDGAHDGLWTCRRGAQTFVFNWTDKPIQKTIDAVEAAVAPRTIWVKPK